MPQFTLQSYQKSHKKCRSYPHHKYLNVITSYSIHYTKLYEVRMQFFAFDSFRLFY